MNGHQGLHIHIVPELRRRFQSLIVKRNGLPICKCLSCLICCLAKIIQRLCPFLALGSMICQDFVLFRETVCVNVFDRLSHNPMQRLSPL